MRKENFNVQNSLIYNKKGEAEVNKQMMNSYKSGSINKQGMHGELKHTGENK